MASTAHTAMAKQTLAAMWPEDGESEEANAFMGYLVFVGIRLAMATAAALLVYWQVSTPRVGSRRCNAATRVLAARLTRSQAGESPETQRCDSDHPAPSGRRRAF